MSVVLTNAVTDLLNREPAKLVAATGIFFDTLGRRYPQRPIEDMLESHRSGVWGDDAAEGCGYPVLRSTNMRGSKADVDDVAWRKIPVKQAAGCALQTGDILVTKSSGSSDLVGKSVLFIQPGDGRTYLFSNFTHRLRPNTKLIDPGYLAWFLRSPQALSWRYEAQQNAVGLRNLQTAEFLSQRLPTPPLAFQKTVTNYFDALEVRSEENVELPAELAEQQRVVARIEELATQIDEARTLRQKAQEEVEALGKFSMSAFVDNEAGARPLRDLCVQITDGEHATPLRIDERQVPLATAKNVRDGHLDMRVTDFVSKETAEKCWKRCKPKDGDVLMVCVGATTGRVCRLVSPPEMVIVRSVAMLRCNQQELDSKYLEYSLKSREVQDQVWDSVKQAAQPCLYLNRIGNLTIPTPPLSEQRRIVAELDALQAEVDALKRLQAETAAELDALMPSILSKAFAGEL
jgi:restriction endonuclease S subunit